MMKNKYLIDLILLLATCLHSSCSKEDTEPVYNEALQYGTFTDSRDGTEYRTIIIGDQTWMAENLRYIVKSAKSTEDNVYGQMYDEYDITGACPAGWHLPSEEEWMELADLLGGIETAGGSLKEAGTDHWQTPNTGATNVSGFTALPAGCYDYNSGGSGRERNTGFWTSSENQYGTEIIIRLFYNSENIEFSEEGAYDRCYSIRCIKD